MSSRLASWDATQRARMSPCGRPPWSAASSPTSCACHAGLLKSISSPGMAAMLVPVPMRSRTNGRWLGSEPRDAGSNPASASSLRRSSVGRTTGCYPVCRRFESCRLSFLDVAQLVSALPSDGRGRRFESCHPDFRRVRLVVRMPASQVGGTGSSPVRGTFGGVAQLVRAPACHVGGPRVRVPSLSLFSSWRNGQRVGLRSRRL